MRLAIWLISISCFIPWISTQAEIVTDGSLGSAGSQEISGPQYTINENLGQRLGGNLFHSFSQFNVLQNETATFLAGSDINNILARITGGEISTLNGIISTADSIANLWLINPNGWIIGKNAGFEINGGLHISTGDAIGLSDGGKFYANLTQNSQLTIGAPLTVQLDQPSQSTITIDQADIQLPENQTLSLTSEKIVLNHSAITVPGGKILIAGLESSVLTITEQKKLAQPSGTIILNGVLKDQQATLTTSQQGITIDGNTPIPNIGGGSIQLLAETIELQHALIEQRAVTELQGGDIQLTAQSIQLSDASTISTSVVTNDGDAGNITLQADQLILTDQSSISSDSQFFSSGNAGNIEISLTNHLTLKNDSEIVSSNNGLGAGGMINITTDHIILSERSALQVGSTDVGDAGQLTVVANNITLRSGGTFESSSLFQGQGGRIDIQSQQIRMSDPETFITSSTFGTGQGGTINIQTEQLTVANQAQIRTLNQGKGNAGTIQLSVNDQFRLENAAITTQALQSDGGPIRIESNTVFLRHGQVTTSVAGPLGDGGNIDVLTNNLIMDGGFIQANTAAADAFGGDINITADNLFTSGANVLVGGEERLQFNPQSRLNVIQAAAPLGVSGNINLNTLELNVSGQLLPLNSRFGSRPAINNNPCNANRGQQISSLIALGRGGLPKSAVDNVTTQLHHYLTPIDTTSSTPTDNNHSYSLLPCSKGHK